MEPSLSANRSVTLERQPLGFGHLGAYVGPDGGVVVHRHIASIGGRMLFLGDANPRFDALVPAGSFIGRVTSIDGGGPPPRRVAWTVRRSLRLVPREARAWIRRRRR
jgi:hypothetical protein